MLYEQTLDEIKEYYGKVLDTNDDLKTNACCTAEMMPHHLREILAQIHPDVISKFYGCGSPIPYELEGKTVLDLGSGSGRDCFILSKLVGPFGKVIGVDMTDEQLAVAREHVDYHMAKFGYSESNITFHKGYIEDLAAIGIEDNSIDVVVSNCVLNLSPDKSRVFSEIWRVLKPGGEMYFSDVFSGRRVPTEVACDPVLVGECLGGALYIEDFRRMLSRLGCLDYRIVSKYRITLNNWDVEQKAGMIDFWSMTVRAFKLDMEDRCENYGQVAFYKGGIEASPHAFTLDDHHTFPKGIPVPVCGNTANMLSKSRYARYFNLIGDTTTHHGLFDCGPETAATDNDFGACC